MNRQAKFAQLGMTLTRGDRLSAPARMNGWGLVGLNLTVLGGLGFYRWGYSLPWRHCLFQLMVGFPSPACGLTRSLLALSQGNWQLALSYHLFAPLLWLLCALAGIKAALELTLGRSLHFTFQPPFSRIVQPLWHWRSLAFLGGVFLAYYLLRLYVRFAIAEIPDATSLNLWTGFVWGAKAL